MKANMYKLIIAMLGVMIMQKVKAQEDQIGVMTYSYDAAGNRQDRTLLVQFFKKQSLDTSGTSIPLDSIVLEPNKQNDTISKGVLSTELQPAVYPNPTNDNLTIELLYNINKLKIAKSQIYIYDSKNALIDKRTTSTLKEEVNLSNLSSGKYLVIIESQENRYFFKIIKN